MQTGAEDCISPQAKCAKQILITAYVRFANTIPTALRAEPLSKGAFVPPLQQVESKKISKNPLTFPLVEGVQ